MRNCLATWGPRSRKACLKALWPIISVRRALALPEALCMGWGDDGEVMPSLGALRFPAVSYLGREALRRVDQSWRREGCKRRAVFRRKGRLGKVAALRGNRNLPQRYLRSKLQ